MSMERSELTARVRETVIGAPVGLVLIFLSTVRPEPIVLREV